MMSKCNWCIWLLIGLLAAACSPTAEGGPPAAEGTPTVTAEAGGTTPEVDQMTNSSPTPTERHPTKIPRAVEPETPVDESNEETANVVVTVITTPEVADVLLGNEPASAESQALIAALEELDVTMEPMHPGIEAPTLKVFYTISVPNAETAQKVIDRLLAMPEAIEGAYVTPDAELP